MEVLRREYRRLKKLEGVSNEQERGRLFDFFIACLLAQIPGVECVAKQDTERGEVDVLADFTGACSRLHRLTGNYVAVENKWEKSSTKQREIHIHHRKAESLTLNSTSLVSIFISMGGFTADAESEIGRCENPTMTGLVKHDVERLLSAESLEDDLRDTISRV